MNPKKIIMKLLLIDKHNNLLVHDHWDWTIISNESVEIALSENWTVIKLLNDYDTIWDIKVVVDENWEIDYK